MKKGHSQLNPRRERALGQICFLTTRDIPDIQAQLTDFRAAPLLRGVQEEPEIEALSEGLQSQYNHLHSRCQVFSDTKRRCNGLVWGESAPGGAVTCKSPNLTEKYLPL